jgi:hypothetical protein
VSAWAPRGRKWPWYDFLTDDERAEVAIVERDSWEAKRKLAAATAILNPIRNRAIQRAKYAARLPTTPIEEA